MMEREEGLEGERDNGYRRIISVGDKVWVGYGIKKKLIIKALG